MFKKMNGLEKLLWVLGILSLPVALGLFLLTAARILLHLRTIAEALPGLQLSVPAAASYSKPAPVSMHQPVATISVASGGSTAKSAVVPSVWTCKCGTVNPTRAIQCRSCAEYR